jgi:hypothetical protein
MARNERRTLPLGYQAGECWGNILAEDPEHNASAHAARFIFQHGGKGGGPMLCRLMVKFEEIEKYPDQHAIALKRIRRAQSYGCKVQLVIDCFNKAKRREDYHRYVYLPRDRPMWIVVRELVNLIQPEQVEVFNEFWYTKGGSDMTLREYRGHVYEFAKGLRQSQHEPLLVGSIRMDKPRDTTHDLWVWDVEWNNCAEAYHYNILSNSRDEPPIPTTPEGLKTKLEEQPYAVRGKAIGWVWPLILGEGTPVGDQVNLNTLRGREMMNVWIKHHQRFKLPVVILAMGGYRSFHGDNEWGMETHFVDDKGRISEGADELLDMMEAPAYDPGDPIDPPVDPPDPPTSDWDESLDLAQEDLVRARKRGPNRRGIRSAERVIEHCEEAIGRA